MKEKKGGNTIHDDALDFKLKRIMPNRCSLCTAGIGKSMLLVDGVWEQYQHDDEQVHWFSYMGKRYKLCDSCIERVETTSDLVGLMKGVK